MAKQTSEFVVYAQHGWADDRKAMAALAYSLTDPATLVVAPSLGFVKTWLRIEPLIQAVEQVAMETSQRYADRPFRIIGHSMGGLIWLEVLHRHPEWWSRVDALVLVASPIGGADLGRLLDPLSLGFGIARDLGRNRRPLAEAIAASIPTLVIAGDIDGGSDGTITVESTKIFGAEFVQLAGINHAALRTHPAVATAIRQFWKLPKTRSELALTPELPNTVIRRLRSVEGMTDAHPRDFGRSQICITFQDGMTIRVWKHPIGIDHVFVACPAGTCLYSGFVGWMHTFHLRQTLEELKHEHASQLAC
jgi:pimeloyl-ACP methyl ester carboxylesterase